MILFCLIWVESESPMLVMKKSSKMKFIWLGSGLVPVGWTLQDDAGATRHAKP